MFRTIFFIFICIVFVVSDFDFIVNSHHSNVFSGQVVTVNKSFLFFYEQVRNDIYSYTGTGNSGFMTMSITDDGCPGDCGSRDYKCGDYETINDMSYGYYHFEVKTPIHSVGTSLDLKVWGVSDPQETVSWSISMAMYGNKRQSIECYAHVDSDEIQELAILPSSIRVNESFHSFGFGWNGSCIVYHAEGEVLHSQCGHAGIPKENNRMNMTLLFWSSASPQGESVFGPFDGQNLPRNAYIRRLAYHAGKMTPPGPYNGGGDDDDDDDDGNGNGSLVWIILISCFGGVFGCLLLIVVIIVIIVIIVVIIRVKNGQVKNDFDLVDGGYNHDKNTTAYMKPQTRYGETKTRYGETQTRYGGGNNINVPKRREHNPPSFRDFSQYSKSHSYTKKMPSNAGRKNQSRPSFGNSSYSMESSSKSEMISKISKDMYLGNFEGSTDYDLLRKYKIKAVVNCMEEAENFFEDDFIYYNIRISDEEDTEIYKYFESFFDLVEDARGGETPIFVHCQAGISRSPTLVIAYLMKKNKWSFVKAINFVQKKRKIVDPNSGFCDQLQEYEMFLKSL